MFEVGFSEICLVGLVSLLVIGPEKLPQVARFVGYWLGKIRHMTASVKQEFQEQLYAEEVRQLLKQQSELMQRLDDQGKELEHLVAVETQQLHSGLVNAIAPPPLIQPSATPHNPVTTENTPSVQPPVPKKRLKSKRKHHHVKK